MICYECCAAKERHVPQDSVWTVLGVQVVVVDGRQLPLQRTPFVVGEPLMVIGQDSSGTVDGHHRRRSFGLKPRWEVGGEQKSGSTKKTNLLSQYILNALATGLRRPIDSTVLRAEGDPFQKGGNLNNVLYQHFGCSHVILPGKQH